MKPSRLPLAFCLAAALAVLFFCAALTSCAENPPAPAAAVSELPPIGLVYAKGRIDIEGGLIRLAASRDGLVKEVAVEEGQRVRLGDVLAVIDDQPARLALAVAQAELAQTHAALPALRVRLTAAERESARLEPLLVAEAAARADVDQARDQAALLRAELAAAESAVVTAAARLRAGEYEIEQRIVRADLEERFVEKVRAGQNAEVVLEADETRVIPGKILRVGQVFGVKTPTGEPGERLDQRVVECVVSVEDQTLRIGQRVLVRLKP